MAGKSRSLGSLLVNVGADTRALETGLKSATSSVNQFGTRTAATTKKARSNFSNVGTGAMGMGASIAARAGAAGMAALAPVLGVGALMGATNSLTSPASDSPRNMMRKLQLEQRKMRIRMMGGSRGDFISDLNFYSSPANLYDISKLGALEYLTNTGGGPNTMDRHLQEFMSPGNKMADPIPKEWNRNRTIRFDGDLGVVP